MRTLLFLISGLLAGWYFMDISSESGLESVLFPFLFVVSLIGLLLKVVFLFHARGMGGPDGNGVPELGGSFSDE